MKTMKNLFLATFSFAVILMFSSCKDQLEQSYIVNNPEYMSYSDLRTSFHVKSAQIIHKPGKIYFKDDYIFVNEYQKGIHVINNSNPRDPQKVSFIEIPGNVDMAIKGDKMYADSYVDLLTIDISNLNDIKEVDRDTSAFPYIIPDYETGVLGEVDYTKGVIVGYNQTVETDVNSGDIYYRRFPMWEGELFFAMNDGAKNISASGNGTGGSMARFLVYDDYLYAIDQASLHLYNLEEPSNPKFQKQIAVSWQIETLFPYEQKLFIGAQNGMFIFSLIDPANPEFISQFRHVTACDPVVVEGNYAYVTLRGGNRCGALESQLDVIDISNIENPVMVKDYPLENPYGLGIDESILFICDGNAGLKVYNASDPNSITDHLLKQYKDINAYDVIPLGSVLLLIGTDGLYQYDYSNPQNIEQLSYLPIYPKNE